jgi:hypothetical protein
MVGCYSGAPDLSTHCGTERGRVRRTILRTYKSERDVLIEETSTFKTAPHRECVRPRCTDGPARAHTGSLAVVSIGLMSATLDGLLCDVGALSAQLAAREEIARCLRDDYLELGDRLERLLLERDSRRSRRGQVMEGAEAAAQGRGREDPARQPPKEAEENDEQQEFRKLLPREFVKQRAYLSRRRDEWKERQQHAVAAAAAARSEFVAHTAKRGATVVGNSSSGPRFVHAQLIAIRRAYEQLHKLLSTLPEPAPEPAAIDPAATWADISDETLVRLCIMVRALPCCTAHCIRRQLWPFTSLMLIRTLLLWV